MIVYAVVDDALSPDFPLGDALEVFIRREDAERFIEEVRGDDPELAASCGSRSAELEAGGLAHAGGRLRGHRRRPMSESAQCASRWFLVN